MNRADVLEAVHVPAAKATGKWPSTPHGWVGRREPNPSVVRAVWSRRASIRMAC